MAFDRRRIWSKSKWLGLSAISTLSFAIDSSDKIVGGYGDRIAETDVTHKDITKVR